MPSREAALWRWKSSRLVRPTTLNKTCRLLVLVYRKDYLLGTLPAGKLWAPTRAGSTGLLSRKRRLIPSGLACVGATGKASFDGSSVDDELSACRSVTLPGRAGLAHRTHLGRMASTLCLGPGQRSELRVAPCPLCQLLLLPVRSPCSPIPRTETPNSNVTVLQGGNVSRCRRSRVDN